jgi:hypothetical protein
MMIYPELVEAESGPSAQAYGLRQEENIPRWERRKKAIRTFFCAGTKKRPEEREDERDP